MVLENFPPKTKGDAVTTIVLFDAIALLAAAGAGGLLILHWKSIQGRDIKVVLAGLLIFSMIYAACLLIEWTGLSLKLDKLEDFIGALLPMWWAFVFYSFLQRVDTFDLQKSEENLRITLNSIGDGMIATDAFGMITRMNPVAEKLTGFTVETALGRPLTDVFRIINAKSKQKADNPVSKVLQSGKVVGLANHTTLISKTGDEFQISDSAAPIVDAAGRISGAVLVFRDVTEEYAHAQELFRLRNYLANIINSMPSAIIGVDRYGSVTQWNNHAVEMAGIAPADAVGRPLKEVLPRLTPEIHRIEEAMSTKKVLSHAKRSYQSDGEVRYEDLTIFPLLANGAEGAVVRLDDVTDRIRMEEVMIQSEKMLSVGGLAGGMAHEINNPLAGMMQTADVMSDRLTNLNLPANQRAAQNAGTSMESINAFMEARGIPRMLKNILQSGSRASEIVQDMLSFARKSDGEFSTHSLPLLLDKTIELARTDYDLKKKYDFRRIKIMREYEDNLPEIPCEAGKIQQVLLNILRNGAEAMYTAALDTPRQGEKEIPTFLLRLTHQKGTGMIRIIIKDNGPGMDEATCRRVFEPFFTTKPTGQGTGLGLSVSYYIITENHDGRMSVESTQGQGTTFIIQLPVGRKSKEAD